LLAALSSVFATLAAVIAAIGLLGMLAYTVSRRRREIGIRVAVGATIQDAGQHGPRGVSIIFAMRAGSPYTQLAPACSCHCSMA
jgi:hypothetical protein